jgi:hypothetical protein
VTETGRCEETSCEDENWTEVNQDGAQLWDIAMTVLNIQFP